LAEGSLEEGLLEKIKRNSEAKVKSYHMETGCEIGAEWDSRNLPFRCLYENDYNQNFFFNPGPSMTYSAKSMWLKW